MNKYDTYLSQEETEELCRAYLDCQLSVMEETELLYVLSKLPYTSECIDEVRLLMQLSLPPQTSNSPKHSVKRFSPKTYIGIAASIAIFISIGFAFFKGNAGIENASDALYIAYMDGHKLSSIQSKEVVKSDMLRADEFILRMEELENQEKERFEDFINQIPSDL